MKVNKKSWHYKFLKWYTDSVSYNLPKTLCSYFWTIVIAPIHIMFLLSASFMISYGLTLGFMLPYLLITGMKFQSDFIQDIASIGAMVDFSFLFILFIGTIVTNDNLISSYIISVKNKFCPIIEYEDE